MTPLARRLPIAALLVCLAAPLHADTEAQRHTLVGLKSLHLEFAVRGDDPQSFGLDEASLRPETEARLTAAGITLVDAEGSRHVPGVPWLFLDISTMKADDSKGYAWLLRLRLQQRACLERDPQVCESVATWEHERFGSVGRRKVKTLREDIADVVNQFVGAYLAANPVR
jgi:hypothetical protein